MYSLVISLVIMLMVAIFSIQNKDIVNVNFLLWNMQIPLVILVLSAATLGAVMVGLLGIVKQISMGRKIKELNNKMKKMDTENNQLKNKLDTAEKQLEERIRQDDQHKGTDSTDSGKGSEPSDSSDSEAKQGILMNPTLPIR